MSPARARQLEERVARVEEELYRLKCHLSQTEKSGWEAIVGTFKDDLLFKDIVREGQKVRRADREAARTAPAGKAARRKRPETRRTSQTG